MSESSDSFFLILSLSVLHAQWLLKSTKSLMNSWIFFLYIKSRHILEDMTHCPLMYLLQRHIQTAICHRGSITVSRFGAATNHATCTLCPSSSEVNQGRVCTVSLSPLYTLRWVWTVMLKSYKGLSRQMKCRWLPMHLMELLVFVFCRN